jgi:hypothetical protein
MPYSTRPNAVSAFLSRGGFHRSQNRATRIKGFPITTSGFEVHDQDGWTEVRYTLGSHASHMPPERRRELVDKEMHLMERRLSQRYTATMFEPTEGTSAYKITVTNRTEEN